MTMMGAQVQTLALTSRKVWVASRDAHRDLVPGGLSLQPYRKEKKTRARPGSSRASQPTARSISAYHVRDQSIMPPRPRPKPKPRSGNDSQPLKEVPPSRDEEDSIFIKSGNLTTATWKQMNQIPSGVFLKCNPKSFPSDVEPAHEPYEDYDSGNDEDPRKTAKKQGGKASIPKKCLPVLLSDFFQVANAIFAGSNLSTIKGKYRHCILMIWRRNPCSLCNPNCS